MNQEKDLEVTQTKEGFSGITYSLAAFIVWGVLPLYWKALKVVPAGEILAHRILWSFVFVSIIVTITKRWNGFKEVIKNRSKRLAVIVSALIISANWFMYIWAVNNNHIVETSLGYYISPLLSIVLGVVVLKEKLTKWQAIAVIFATIGVAIITAEYGRIPWIAITLALTFGVYGLVKKLVNVDSIIALTLETVIVAPIALIFLISKEVQGTGSVFAASLDITLLLVFSGVATATPLLWFALAAQKIPLSTIGFIQYLAPTIALAIGVLVYKESFTAIHGVSFSLIWCGLMIYSISSTKFFRRAKQPSHNNRDKG